MKLNLKTVLAGIEAANAVYRVIRPERIPLAEQHLIATPQQLQSATVHGWALTRQYPNTGSDTHLRMVAANTLFFLLQEVAAKKDGEWAGRIILDLTAAAKQHAETLREQGQN